MKGSENPMGQEEYIKGMRQFQHLSLSERGAIKALRKEGYGVSAIAEKVGRNKGTISRELKRGTALQRNSEWIERYEYFAETGAAVYERNRKRRGNLLKAGECVEFITYADTKLKEGWSPDVVVGRAKESGEWEGKPIVCAKTLYNYIDKCLMTTRNIDLALKVRRKPKNKRVRKNKTILGESIESRPKEVAAREEFGHWEIDSVIGKQTDKTAVMTLVERKTRDQIAIKLEGRDSAAVDKAVSKIYARFEGVIVKSGV
jgi:IS30 family transposase